MIILTNRNFRLRFEWDWNEFGVGFVLFKSIHKPFPRKNSWIGITIRLLWFGIFIKILERKQDTTALEIYEQKERLKEISAFHYRELIAFKNKRSLDVSWKWTYLGILIYHRTPKAGDMSGDFSLQLSWFSISFDYGSNQILQENSQEAKNLSRC